MRKRQRVLFAATVLVAVLAYAVSSVAAGSSGGLGAAAVTNYVKYVDGKSGKANPKLSPVQVAELEAALDAGPAACGHADQCWSLAILGR